LVQGAIDREPGSSLLPIIDITTEWAIDIFTIAKREVALRICFNGFATSEVLIAQDLFWMD
jgi:hypothetical protein